MEKNPFAHHEGTRGIGGEGADGVVGVVRVESTEDDLAGIGAVVTVAVTEEDEIRLLRDVDALGPAMHGVRPGIAGFPEDFLGLDDLVDLGRFRAALGVDDVDAGGGDARNDQETPLQEGVAGQRRQRPRTGVPAEMVKLVALVGHDHLMDDLTECFGFGINIDNGKPIGL